MTRAQRRRAEREAKKGSKVVEQRITGAEESIRIALLKENIARDVDRKLYDKFSKEYDGDIERFMKELEDRTGFSFEIDSVSGKDE